MSLSNLSQTVNTEFMQTMDSNFEYLIERYNSMVSPINEMLSHFSPYPFEELTEITSEDITPYIEENTISSIKLNNDFGLFKNKLLALGISNNGISSNLDDYIYQLEEYVVQIPSAPTGLTGVLSDGATLTCGLSWTNHNPGSTESYQEVHVSSDYGQTYSLMELPIAHAEFSETTLNKLTELNIGDVLIEDNTIHSYCKYYWKCRAVKVV